MTHGKLMLLCIGLAMNSLNCGDAEPQANLAEDGSPMRTVTAVKQKVDGTYEVTKTMYSQAQIQAQVEARKSYVKRLAEGDETQPIYRDWTCDWTYSTWLTTEQSLEGDLCCVTGSGGAHAFDLCGSGFYFKSLYSGNQPGRYNNVLWNEFCSVLGVAFGAYDYESYLVCPRANYISLE